MRVCHKRIVREEEECAWLLYALKMIMSKDMRLRGEAVVGHQSASVKVKMDSCSDGTTCQGPISQQQHCTRFTETISTCPFLKQ
jgi:hypothetical protein